MANFVYTMIEKSLKKKAFFFIVRTFVSFKSLHLPPFQNPGGGLSMKHTWTNERAENLVSTKVFIQNYAS